MPPGTSLSDRLISLLDHRIGRAHIASQIPSDIAGNCGSEFPERVGGIVPASPRCGLTPRRSPKLGGTTVMKVRRRIRPERRGRAARDRAASRCAAGHPRRYEAQGWADVAERTGGIAAQVADAPKLAGEGSHAGINYRIEGSGAALILLRMFAASQSAPATPALAKHFTPSSPSAGRIGGVAHARGARGPPAIARCSAAWSGTARRPGNTMLDCSLDRRLAEMADNPITAIHPKHFLLREAAALAKPRGSWGGSISAHATPRPCPSPTLSTACSR